MFIHFFCLCPLSLTIKMNFNISKVVPPPPPLYFLTSPLIVETAVIHLFIVIVPIATEKVSRIRSNIIWNPWKSTLRARST